eukprot:gb/GEZN01010420.1/.p1 GENE.gb/GEZN01010420.1/~~gb/GEZN01010420.1/.p1  ORF type:complete len:306 (-),score=35.29 gb/GEZN01010420.1/:109-1026(-)
METPSISKSEMADCVTALGNAAMWDEEEQVRFLLARGVDANARDKWGSTALHHAAGEDAGASAKLLLRARADAGVTNNFGLSPLHLAATEGHVQMAELLLQARADVKATDRWTMSVLHHAACGGHVEMARLLVRVGAVPAATTMSGHSALDWAQLKSRRCRVGDGLRWAGMVEFLDTFKKAGQLLTAVKLQDFQQVACLAEEGAPLSQLECLEWKHPIVTSALESGTQKRLRPDLTSVLAVLDGQVLPPLQYLICEYTLPVGWKQLQDVMNVIAPDTSNPGQIASGRTASRGKHRHQGADRRPSI